MTEWTKVIMQPLGLAGFALFLVFGYLAKAAKKDARRWISPVAVGLALVALVGGLLIAYSQVSQRASNRTAPTEASQPPKQQINSSVQQISTGQGSPNVQGVQGDVTITVDQSTDKTKTNKTREHRPKPASQ